MVSIIEALENQPGLKHLSKHAATCLAAHQRLESSGTPWGQSGQGVTQGDPESGPEYNVTWHHDVIVLDQELAESGGMARFGNDDGYAIGPPEIAFTAVQKFLANVSRCHGLEYNVSKTKCYHISGMLPPQTPPNNPPAGVLINGVFWPGFLCYGVAIGSKQFVDNFLGLKVQQLSGEMDRVVAVLKNDNQAAWTLLSTSLTQQLDYSLTLQYPHDILPFASSLDDHVWSVLEQICGQHIPKEEEGLGTECVVVVPQVPLLAGGSFQSTLIKQPIKLGGIGLRSLVETCPVAFLGGVEMSVPHMVVSEDEELGSGICPQLEDVVGQVKGPVRWEEFLRKNSKTASEFIWSWNQLHNEASSIWELLDLEPSGVLSTDIVGARCWW